VLIQRAEFQVTEASDGLEAVEKAKQLHPDLILLDISLPNLNGLEVARRVRTLVPTPRILFVSQESSTDVVEEALSLGGGYIHKPRLTRDLLPAIEAVLGGKPFVGSGLKRRERSDGETARRHEILFCSDEEAVLDSLTAFIAAALNGGNAAILWATESHRRDIHQRLRDSSVDIDAAIERGTYIASDVNEPPDPMQMARAFASLAAAASKADNRRPSVAVCGERAGRFWADGRTDEATRLEHLLEEFAKSHDLEVLCPYPLPQAEADDPGLKTICQIHSAVRFR